MKLGIDQFAVRGRLEAIEKDTGIKLILSWKENADDTSPDDPETGDANKRRCAVEL